MLEMDAMKVMEDEGPLHSVMKSGATPVQSRHLQNSQNIINQTEEYGLAVNRSIKQLPNLHSAEKEKPKFRARKQSKIEKKQISAENAPKEPQQFKQPPKVGENIQKLSNFAQKLKLDTEKSLKELNMK